MKKLLLALAMVVTLGVLGGGAVQATTNMKTGTDVKLGANEVVNASYYAAGETVVIEGTVRGDVYCAGQTVEVRGMVEGDVLCAGQEVRVGGVVKGDIRLAGQNIVVDGEVAKNATLMGQVVTIDGKIMQDATVSGQLARVNGSVGRDLTAGVERLTIDGMVKRNVEASVDALALRDKSQIGGNLSYTSYEEADRSQGAMVAGTTERHMPEYKESAPQDGPYSWFMGGVVVFLLLLPLGLVWIAVMPRAARSSADMMRQRWLLSIGLGLVALIMIPVVAILLMVTIIGLPLGLILLFLWALSLPAAFIMASYSFGEWLAGKAGWAFKGRELVALLIGLAIVTFVASLPFVGWLVAFVSILCGLGAIALMKYRFIAAQYGHKTKKKVV